MADPAAKGTPTSPPPGDWFDRLPKVELHVHLEGAIPHAVLWELVQRYGGDRDTPSRAALERRFVYTGFADFIRTWIWQSGFLRSAGDLTLIAAALGRELVRQRVAYAEVIYSPVEYLRRGLSVPKVTRAVRAGFDRVPEVEVALVCDLVRDFGARMGRHTLRAVAEVREELGVVGITIGGSEARVPPSRFAKVFAEARELGFHVSAHAGEGAGPRSVAGALEHLRVERIGHGVRAVEDAALVAELAERRIPLEVCITSNVCTGVVPSVERHPITALRDAGAVVTINTDDPGMFPCTISSELRLLVERLGWRRDQVREVLLAGVRSSWLPADRRAALERAFVADPVWSETES